MTPIWPALTREDVIAFQFSSWFSTFSSLSIKSTVIPVADEFRSYLEADGVFVPIGSENSCVFVLVKLLSRRTIPSRPPRSTLEDDNADHDSDSDNDGEAIASAAVRYAFPELDAQIRAVIEDYGGAVFPKLNFSSPKVRPHFVHVTSRRSPHVSNKQNVRVRAIYIYCRTRRGSCPRPHRHCDA
jgi:hypothetical protein